MTAPTFLTDVVERVAQRIFAQRFQSIGLPWERAHRQVRDVIRGEAATWCEALAALSPAAAAVVRGEAVAVMWRPIETAPSHNGARIIAWPVWGETSANGQAAEVVRRVMRRIPDRWEVSPGTPAPIQPTHWMPMPASPYAPTP